MYTKNRNLSIDILRIICAVAVVLTHANHPIETAFGTNSPEFFFSYVYETISRFAVPVFLMISGAFMLDENKPMTTKDIFLKYFKNITILLIIWSAAYAGIYKIVFPIIKGSPISASGFLSSFLYGHYQMWFLYVLLGIYLTLPFLRAFVKKTNKNLVLAFIIIASLIQGVYPWLCELTKYSELLYPVCRFIQSFYIQFFNGYILFYLIGWYIFRIGFNRKSTRVLLYVGGLVGLFTNILYISLTQNRTVSHSPLNIFTILYATAIFTLFSQAKFHFCEKARKKIFSLSSLTFGVYMIHPIVLDIVFKIVPYKNIAWLYIPVWSAVAVVISFGISYLISKIPFAKKLIRL